MSAVRPLSRTRPASPQLAAPGKADTLGVALLRDGLIAGDAMVQALAQQAQRRGRVTDILLSRAALPTDQVYAALAAHWETSVIDPDQTPPDPRLIDRLGAGACLRTSMLPWRNVGGATVIATAEPEDFAKHRDHLTRMFPIGGGAGLRAGAARQRPGRAGRKPGARGGKLPHAWRHATDASRGGGRGCGDTVVGLLAHGDAVAADRLDLCDAGYVHPAEGGRGLCGGPAPLARGTAAPDRAAADGFGHRGAIPRKRYRAASGAPSGPAGVSARVARYRAGGRGRGSYDPQGAGRGGSAPLDAHRGGARWPDQDQAPRAELCGGPLPRLDHRGL